MPELYGNPYKWELRKEINQLRTELWNERKEHSSTRRALRYAQCEIEELKATIQRIEQKTRELLSEATSDIEAKIGERFVQSVRSKRLAS